MTRVVNEVLNLDISKRGKYILLYQDPNRVGFDSRLEGPDHIESICPYGKWSLYTGKRRIKIKGNAKGGISLFET